MALGHLFQFRPLVQAGLTGVRTAVGIGAPAVPGRYLNLFVLGRPHLPEPVVVAEGRHQSNGVRVPGRQEQAIPTANFHDFALEHDGGAITEMRGNPNIPRDEKK